MLADAGSIPAISTTQWSSQDQPRPLKTLINRALSGFFMPTPLVSLGLNKSLFGHHLGTRRAQTYFLRRQEPKQGQDVRHTTCIRLIYSTSLLAHSESSRCNHPPCPCTRFSAHFDTQVLWGEMTQERRERSPCAISSPCTAISRVFAVRLSITSELTPELGTI